MQRAAATAAAIKSKALGFLSKLNREDARRAEALAKRPK